MPQVPLPNAENLCQLLLDHVDQGVYCVDNEQRICYWNRGAERLTGYAREEVLGTRWRSDILLRTDERHGALSPAGAPIVATLQDGMSRELSLFLRHRQGYRVPVSVRTAPMHDTHQRVIGALEVISDESYKLALLDEMHALRTQVFIDSLTEVANRRYLEQSLQARLDELRRYGWACGVALLDIDYFKQVNDQHGHATGDEVLRMVARTLVRAVRRSDIVGRWGGEEFLIIFRQPHRRALIELSERIRTLISQAVCMTSKGIPLQVQASLGVTWLMEGDTVTACLQRADALLYRSKSAGRNRVTIDIAEVTPAIP